MSFIELITAIVCPFLYIFLLNGFFVYLFRKKLNFQTVLPITLMSATLFIFLTTIVFHSISIGFWITVIAALAFIPMAVLDRNRSQVFKENMFTPGFVVFCLIYVFLLILDWYKIVPLLSDTSMHWAPHVWTMWLRDDFYTSPNLSIVNHGEYPPAVQLFELIFSRAAGMYHEGLLFFAMQILGFSMLLPILDKLVWQKRDRFKQWSLVVLLSLTLLTIPLVFFVSDFYFSLEVDAILGIIFAYSIYLAITESRNFKISGLLVLSIVVTFLCLTKQIAVLLAGLVVLTYLSGLYLSYKKQLNYKKIIRYFKHWQDNWRLILLVLAVASLPIISLKLWSHQIEGYVSPDPGIVIFHLEPNDALQIPSIVAGKSGSDSQQHFSRAFIRHLLFDPGGFLLNYLNSASYMQVALLFIGLMGLIWLINKDRAARHRILIVGTIVTAGWFLYCFAIYCVFLFGGMRPVELFGNDVSNRYLRTYLFAMMVIAAFYLIIRLIDDYSSRKRASKSFMYFVAVLIVCFGLLVNKGTFAVLGIQSINDRRAEFTTLNTYQTKTNVLKLAKGVGTYEKPSKILITAKSDDERHYLQYNAVPNRIALLLFEKDISRDDVCDKIAHFDYFIIGYDYPVESNWSIIKSCLPENTKLEVGNIYRIIHNERLTLEKI